MPELTSIHKEKDPKYVVNLELYVISNLISFNQIATRKSPMININFMFCI